MSKCINQKHFNHQKATRRRNALAKRATRQKAVIDPSTAIPRALSGDASALLTPHQRQAKNSNPGANVKLSKKKLKQVKKRARIVTDYVDSLLGHPSRC